MRILMVEDDEALCEVIGIHLKACGYVADFCHDGEEGVFCACQNAYDLILLDRMMPSMDGLEVLAAIRKEEIFTPVLLLTAMNDITDRVDGLDAGADDYLTKPFAMEELLARIRAMLRRAPRLEAGNELAFKDVRFEPVGRKLSGPKESCTLALKESELLELLLKNPNQILTRGQLFAHVWGPSAEVEDANLDRYIHYLRRRLAAVGSTLQIKTVRGTGYQIEVGGC